VMYTLERNRQHKYHSVHSEKYLAHDSSRYGSQMGVRVPSKSLVQSPITYDSSKDFLHSSHRNKLSMAKVKPQSTLTLSRILRLRRLLFRLRWCKSTDLHVIVDLLHPPQIILHPIKFLAQEVIAQVQHPKRSMKISQEAQNLSWAVIVSSSDAIYNKSRLQKIHHEAINSSLWQVSITTFYISIHGKHTIKHLV